MTMIVILEFIEASWAVMGEMAPWLLLGAAIAGALYALLPKSVTGHLTGYKGIIVSLLIGLPLPLCSCGVIPAAVGLRRQGASASAVATFLVVTPQTGIDSFLVTGGVLGWHFALIRVAVAIVIGLAVGALVETFAPSKAKADSEAGIQTEKGLTAGIGHGLQVLRSIWLWIVIGALASGLFATLSQHGYFSLSGLSEWAATLGALGLSLPLYVCATASVPIAGALVGAGAPTGAALVFLIAGPATNISTMGIVRKELGGRTLVVYICAIVIGAVAASMIWTDIGMSGAMAGHDHGMSWWRHMAAAAVCLIFVSALWPASQIKSPSMTFDVTGMTCGGCASKVTRALQSADGVIGANVDHESGRAIVATDGTVDAETLTAIMADLGYKACELDPNAA